MSMPSRAVLERAGFVLITACLGVVQFKIGPAQVCFGLAAICWLVVVIRDGTRPALPAFALPLALYAGWTLVSAAMSALPARSIIDSRQLLLFLMVPIVARFAGRRRAMTVIDIVMALGAIGALIGVVQFTMLGFDHLNDRPTGLLSHYMTFSGILMLVTCAAASRLLFYPEHRIWPAVAMPALLVALALTLTQNAWMARSWHSGASSPCDRQDCCCSRRSCWCSRSRSRPARCASRVMNGFSPQTESNRDRLQMLSMGVDMVRDHPLFGVGPEMVGDVYGRYLRPNPVHTYNPHLHNVPMQIAAERGLPALAFFLWFAASALLDAWRQLRRGPSQAIAGAAFAGIVAMLTAGLFEYNFGDSEFLMLFLGLITLPFAARSRDERGPAEVVQPANRRPAPHALSTSASVE